MQETLMMEVSVIFSDKVKERLLEKRLTLE